MPLRLKSLELQGYKTFASRSVFEFASGITAIVGPNGSGKSNIADSLRWVLGEQSYTLLRGKKTEDMIFSGSEHRARAGMAQATVTFDNSTQWLPLDFAEVALSRYAHRDGRNEYLLNNQHIRLREINELLAQAGLSERTYTMLGQGLVDASLALKADDRRRLFEEAAGVGLYRTRRDEALRRLADTERNLERVLDILAELEPRLRSLERQAKRTVEFSRAQADLKLVLREWYGYHWHLAQKELTDARESVRAQELRVTEARELHERTRAEYSSFRERLIGLRSRLSDWHRQSAEMHNQRETLSRELAVLEERRRSLTNVQASILSDQEHVMNEIQFARERFAEAEQEAEKIRAEHEEAKGKLEVVQTSLAELQQNRSGLEAQLAQIRETLEGYNQQRAENNARLDELRSRTESGRARMEQVQAAISNARAHAEKSGENLRIARKAREASNQTLQTLEARLLKQRDHVEGLERERRAALEKRSAEEAEHARLKTQLEVLDQAEQSLTGFADGARFLLEAARRSALEGTRGALSSSLDVPVELEAAIAAALGDTLDAILIDAGSLEDALKLLETDQASRAALLPLEGNESTARLRSDDPDCLGNASELIQYPSDKGSAVDRMLGATLIVRSRASARRLIRQLPPHARVVTLRGEVFRGDGLILAGRINTLTSLGQPRRKREMESRLQAASAALAETRRLVDELSESHSLSHGDLAQTESDLHEARIRLGELQEAEQQAGLEFESSVRHHDWQKAQLEQLEAEARAAESSRNQWTNSLVDLEKTSDEARARLKEVTSKLAGITSDELQSQVSYWATRLAVSEQSLSSAQSRTQELGSEISRLDERRVELASRLTETENALKGLDRDRTGFREQESGIHAQIESERAQILPAERDLETAEQEEKHLQDAEESAQRALANTERILGQTQLDQARKQSALDHLRQRVTDDFGLVMFDYAAEVSGPVPLPFEGMVEELPVVTELDPKVEEQLSHHRGQLRRMGPINPDAKREFDQEKERYEFMKSQVEDLHKAEADLKRVIAELDEITKQEFSRTFDLVDKQFRETFVRLFGGGSARLSLTDPDNLVETGIEIEARLPGRREQGLALLSGGERSLTAIALVFALLKVSPTPVCVMDEVDAMLDEANVGRFRDLLVDLSKDTQFIIITHNRNTVQAADVIYGITMGRDSTSQLISLRLDQVTDDMLKRV